MDFNIKANKCKSSKEFSEETSKGIDIYNILR